MSDFYTNVFNRGDKIFVRGYKNGRRFADIINYTPYLFIPARSSSKTEFKTLEGKPVEKLSFDSISSARDFLKRYDDVDNMDIYGLTNYPYLYIYDTYRGEIAFNPSEINIISLDIETDSSGSFPDISKADKEVTAITISRRGEMVVFGLKAYKPKSDKITFIHCKDEYELLEKFLHVWQSGRFLPDVLTGWNIEFFDIPYLVNRITNLFGKDQAKKLSPWGILEERKIVLHGKDNITYTPAGINVLDYLQLYKKFSFSNEESYRLDNIAEVVLGEKKIDYKALGYESLDDLYKRNSDLFFSYNIQDVALIDKFEEKLGFIELVMAFAYDAKVNYVDTMTTVKPWDIIIHNYLLDRCIVIPQFKKKDYTEHLVGGYVKDVQVGMHEWIVSFDLNSLYPHLIQQYNISPETKVSREDSWYGIDDIVNNKASIPKSDLAYAANGVTFTKNKQGFLPALMEKMYNDRSLYKDKMLEAKKKLAKLEKNSNEYRTALNDVARYHNLQLAKKIQLNSAYGALGNEWFRWFDFDMAEAITLSGQLSIRWVERYVNAYLNSVLKTENYDYTIASDTDSLYINFNPLVTLLNITDPIKIIAALDQFCNTKIQKVINKSFDDLAEYMNAFAQKMHMKRETIADKGIWKAKKMYILNAWNVEGVQYEKPELKIQGIEAVRSSTPKACRSNIKKCLSLIMNKNESDIHKFIHDFRIEFMGMPFEDVAFPRGMNGLEKYKDKNTIYSKGTPIHVKGALLYNNLLKKKNLDDKYPTIGDGDKIKFVYLKLPNPLMEHVIAVPEYIPDELDINKYIDHETQFNKSFLEPIKAILDVVGWETEKKSTLESFFEQISSDGGGCAHVEYKKNVILIVNIMKEKKVS